MAAETFSRNRLPPCGRIAVIPVLIESPRAIVVWPTRTPATSVIALRGPVGMVPTMMSMSRARGRVCAASEVVNRKNRITQLAFTAEKLAPFDN